MILHTPDTVILDHNSVHALFEDDAASHWLFWYRGHTAAEREAFNTGYNYVTLLVRVKDPVIVTGVTLRMCRGPAAVAYVDPKEIYVSRGYWNEYPYDSEGSTLYPLTKGKLTRTITQPPYKGYDWRNLIPTPRVVIHVYRVYGIKGPSIIGGSWPDAIGCISGINLTYTPTKLATYRPRDSWPALKKRLLEQAIHYGHGLWYSAAAKSKQLRYELMYYVFKGNKDAYALWNSYRPTHMGGVGSAFFDYDKVTVKDYLARYHPK